MLPFRFGFPTPGRSILAALLIIGKRDTKFLGYVVRRRKVETVMVAATECRRGRETGEDRETRFVQG